MPRLSLAWLLSASLLAALSTGCDMAEYTKRMDLARARLKVFDEENKVLGKPLEKPSVKAKKAKDKESADKEFEDAWPFDVFLRLPKQIQPTPAGEKDDGILEYKGVRLFRYTGDGDMSLLAAADYVGKDTSEEGKEKPPGITAELLRANVLWALYEHLKKNNYKFHFEDTVAPKALETRTPIGEKGPTLSFEYQRCEAIPATEKKEAQAYSLDFYHYVGGDKQIVLVFQSPKGKEDVSTNEMSLRTLVIGDAAAARRAEYERMHRKK